MTEDRDPSRLRQRLRQTEEQRTKHVERVLSERGPLIRGSFVVQPGRCGKPTCKCSRGEFHSAAVLYGRQGGRTTCTYVPVADRSRVETLNQREREIRQARAALAKLGKQTVELVTRLEEVLAVAYPQPTRASKRSRRQPRKADSEEGSS